jgi:hypothetical protein
MWTRLEGRSAPDPPRQMDEAIRWNRIAGIPCGPGSLGLVHRKAVGDGSAFVDPFPHRPAGPVGGAPPVTKSLTSRRCVGRGADENQGKADRA